GGYQLLFYRRLDWCWPDVRFGPKFGSRAGSEQQEGGTACATIRRGRIYLRFCSRPQFPQQEWVSSRLSHSKGRPSASRSVMGLQAATIPMRALSPDITVVSFLETRRSFPKTCPEPDRFGQPTTSSTWRRRMERNLGHGRRRPSWSRLWVTIRPNSRRRSLAG